MKKDRIGIWTALIEMFIIMVLLMSAFEWLKHVRGVELLAGDQWHIAEIVFSAIIACFVTYFLQQKHIRHNRKLMLEIKYLKKMEEDLREKITELTHFKDLIVWWEKKIIDVEQGMKTIKNKLDIRERSE